MSPGYTLVEVMVAMVIALIVMGGVYRTLLDEDVAHDRGEKILDMQTNARVVLDRLVRDIRRAGFLGCGGTNSASTLLVNYSTADSTKIGKYTLANVVAGGLVWDGKESILSYLVSPPGGGAPVTFDYTGEALGFSDNAISAQKPLYATGSDALTLVYLSDERTATMTGTTNAPVSINAPETYSLGDILYITDCINFTMFQKTNGTALSIAHGAGSINNTDNLGKIYGQDPPARIFKLNTSTYFVRGDGSYTLCLNSTNSPIASNIENLQFEFLFDTNNNGDLSDDTWVSSLGAHTSQEVRAIRIWVFAMSDPDYSYQDTNLYVFPNSPYSAQSPASLGHIVSPIDDEHRHHYLVSEVVYLRNGGLSK